MKNKMQANQVNTIDANPSLNFFGPSLQKSERTIYIYKYI